MISAGLALGVALAATDAQAQVRAPESTSETPTETQSAPAAPDWRVTVGAAAILRPEWDGAKDNDWLVVPDVDVRYGDVFFASFRTGVGFNLINENGLRAGPYAKLKFGRDEGDDAALRGLGDVDATAELGGFVDFALGPVRASLEVRQGVNGHEGLVAEAGADLRWRFAPELFGAIGPRVRWADESYTQTYFGVTPTQSTRSGLPTFTAGSGVESIGVNVSLAWRPTDKVVVTAFAEQGRLQGDAADSPLVRLRGDDDQQRFGLAFGWRLGE